MPDVTFENLNFSFLIDARNRTAYLQEWRNGNWSEAEKFPVPQQIAGLPKQSMLARAIRDFRRDSQYWALCSALGSEPVGRERLRDRFQSASRLLKARIAELIYA